jgi:hypothetical protein
MTGFRVQVSGVSVQVPNGRVLGSGFQDSETQALKPDTLYEIRLVGTVNHAEDVI